jgi:hypothetical protein
MDISKLDRANATETRATLPAYVPGLIARILEQHPDTRSVDRYLELGKANPFPGDKRFCAAWLAEIHRQEGRDA